MLDLFNRYRHIWVSVILLTMPLMFLYVSGRRAHQNSLLERSLLRITSPVQNVSNAIVGRIRGLWNDYIDLVGVRRENKRLKEQIDILRYQRNRMIEVEWAPTSAGVTLHVGMWSSVGWKCTTGAIATPGAAAIPFSLRAIRATRFSGTVPQFATRVLHLAAAGCRSIGSERRETS